MCVPTNVAQTIGYWKFSERMPAENTLANRQAYSDIIVDSIQTGKPKLV